MEFSGSSKKVLYVRSLEYIAICDIHPKVRRRASMVDSLMNAHGLFDRVLIVNPSNASRDDLMTFHSEDYVNCLESVQDKLSDVFQMCSEDENFNEFLDVEDEEHCKSFGLGYDCELFPQIWDYVKAVAGASLTAANYLMKGNVDVAINLNGGWHHGHVDEAAGFCYVNDIVLSILKLLTHFNKVLYVDLDIHHGDGVEEAFLYSNKVFTFSIHKFADGFFPGSGCESQCGSGPGKYYSLNIPLKDGADDDLFCFVFKTLFNEVMLGFDPDAIVVQCGADSLAHDPMGTFNLTSQSFRICVQDILSRQKPTLVLGGGGYNAPNTAKCWTEIVACITGKTLSSDIPDHEYIEKYGPDYSLEITPTNRKNENSSQHIEQLIKNSLSKVHELPAFLNLLSDNFQISEKENFVCESVKRLHDEKAQMKSKKQKVLSEHNDFVDN